MSDRIELSSEMSEKLDALVDRIASANDATDDLRRELRAHLEDKAAAYLNSEQPLGEADVLLLVEKHFGNPVELRGQLNVAHGPDELRRSLVTPNADIYFRRLAAVIVAGVLASFVWQGALPLLSRIGVSPLIAAHTAASALATVTLVLILDRWSARIRYGYTPSPWFVRLAFQQVFFVAIFALAVRWIVPLISIGNSFMNVGPDYGVDRRTIELLLMMRLGVQMVALAYAASWIIWRALGARPTRQALPSAIAAAGMTICIGTVIGPVWSVTQIIGHKPEWNFQGFYPPAATRVWYSGLTNEQALFGMVLFGCLCIFGSRISGMFYRLRHA